MGIGPIPDVIALLTDFGTLDGYVAALKGVILRLNPAANIVDVTHEIAPQDVRGAAYVLHTVHSYFPPGTVHLVVVDPEVGTERAGLIVDTGEALYVAPDNGLLSFLVAEARGPVPPTISMVDRYGNVSTRLPEGWRAIRIQQSRYWLPNPSRTFHGRDIFAPVAAYLSLGVAIGSFGPEVETMRAFEVPAARRLPDGGIEGTILHVDRFGNLITSLRLEDLPRRGMTVEVGANSIYGLSQTYAEGRGLTAVIGSSGYLEIALPNGSALSVLGLGVGSTVKVFQRDGREGRE